MIIKLTKTDLKKCTGFSDKFQKKSDGLYNRRGEARNEKIREDIVLGKMGELAVEKYFKKLKWDIGKDTDFAIYEKHQRSYDCDLVVSPPDERDPFLIHVKTQSVTSVLRYGISYLFQKTDPVIREPTNKDIIACTAVVSDNEVEIYGFISLEDVIKNELIGECKVPSYRSTKVAMYIPKNTPLFENFHIHLEWFLYGREFHIYQYMTPSF